MKLLDEELVVMDAEVKTAEDCIRLGGTIFYEKGYVKEGYTQAVIDREKVYPTGLPGKGVAIAIPHTNNTYVNKPAVGVIIPREPVRFCAMGTKDVWLDCEVIIPLVIKDSDMQISMLKQMMKIIQDGELLKKIRDSKDRAIKVLSVCGSGTVSSAMLSSKLADIFEEKGYEMEATEVSPGGVPGAMQGGGYDLIVYTSPVEGNYGVPILNATGFLVGINEEEFIEELMQEVENLEL